MTLTEKTAAIAATLGLSYSVTDDAAYLLREGTVVGVVDDKDRAWELGVTLYSVCGGGIYEYTVSGKAKWLAEFDKPTSKQHRNIDAKEIKSRYTVLDVWRMLMPQSAPCKDGVYHSPFRDDKNPSFSISKQGRHWKDFSSGEGGDIFDFWMRATGSTLPEAIAALASGATNQSVLPPEPPKEKIIAVTDVQRGFEQQAVDGFGLAIKDADSVMCRLLNDKRIAFSVAAKLWKEGSLGAIDGKPVYLYPFGCKCRNDAETSRSTRFLCGSAHNYVWRHQLLQSPHLKTCIVTEGESDCMRLMSLIPQGLRTLVVAAPGASWRPTLDYCHLLASHRNVVLWFDFDEAGITAAKRLEKQFLEVSHCNVRRVEFQDGDKKDICRESEERVMQLYAEFCCA